MIKPRKLGTRCCSALPRQALTKEVQQGETKMSENRFIDFELIVVVVVVVVVVNIEQFKVKPNFVKTSLMLVFLSHHLEINSLPLQCKSIGLKI